MKLRYQDKDEIDRLAKEERGTPILIFLVVFLALIDGVRAVLTGESLKSYGQGLALLLGFAFVYWVLSPLYYEFRIRTKETNGKTTAILELLEKIDERLDERLNSIEEKLNIVEEHHAELDRNGPQAEHSFFPELTGIQHGLRRLNRVEREMRDRDKLDGIRAGDDQ